jgi:subtilisin family serine protease
MRRFAAFVFVLGSLGLSAIPSTAGAASEPPGHYIVVFKDSVSDPGAVAQQHSRAHQAGVSHVYRRALKGYAATILANRLDDIRSDSRVAYVEADGVAVAFGKPGGGGTTAPVEQTPPGIVAVGATGGGPIDADVWVIDTGVDSHPDLMVVTPFVNFVGGPNRDCNGHGTHVAGTVAAIDNSSYVVGVAPGARIHPVKVLSCSGSGSYSAVIAGVDYVTDYVIDHGISGAVANMSLGGPVSAALDQAVQNSAAAGVLYALAAGNENVDACTTSPAHAGVVPDNGIVVVGALTATASKASFSNWGECVDIWAPGVNVLSTWPGSTMKTLSGTSMASPHVAGGAALYRSTHVGSAAAAEIALEADAREVNGGLFMLDVSAY